MAEPTLVLLNADKITEKWRRIAASFRQPSEARKVVFKRIAKMLMESVGKTFRAGGRPKWRPLKNPSKRRGGASANPLRDRGRLMQSVTGDPRNSGDSLYREVADGLDFGSRVEYAGVHQYGFRGGVSIGPFRRKLPKKITRMVIVGVGFASRRVRRTTKMKYGAGFNAGTTMVGAHRRTMNIPARPFLVPREEDTKAAYKIMSDYLKAQDEADRIKEP